MLVVEVDGRHHEQRRASDARRDRKLARLGYRVLRLEAQLVLRQLPVALALVREALSGRGSLSANVVAAVEAWRAR
jgi:very-short-patch-repair endonuclease